MDFETSRKYAKLMDPETSADQNKDATNSILVVDTKTPGTFQHSVGSEDMPAPIDISTDGTEAFAQMEEASRMNLQTAFDSISELQPMEQNDTPAPVVKKSDHQIFVDQLKLARTSPDTETVVNALEDLSDIASDMDFGLRLSEGEGLSTLVGLFTVTTVT